MDLLFEGGLLARVLCFVVGGKSHLRSFAFVVMIMMFRQLYIVCTGLF